MHQAPPSPPTAAPTGSHRLGVCSLIRPLGLQGCFGDQKEHVCPYLPTGRGATPASRLGLGEPAAGPEGWVPGLPATALTAVTRLPPPPAPPAPAAGAGLSGHTVASAHKARSGGGRGPPACNAEKPAAENASHCYHRRGTPRSQTSCQGLRARPGPTPSNSQLGRVTSSRRIAASSTEGPWGVGTSAGRPQPSALGARQQLRPAPRLQHRPLCCPSARPPHVAPAPTPTPGSAPGARPRHRVRGED